jgi:SAM-dependent methyltransferase
VPDEWVKRDSELTEAEKQRFIIADNIGFGEYDWDVLANEWDKDDLIEWGLEMPDNYGDNGGGWGIGSIGDNVPEKIGYNGGSIWVDMPYEIDVTPLLIELPKQNETKHYSRTTPEEIRRIIFTYMSKGDYFLESCCGWSTFGGIAKYYGFSGIGIDIWDVSIEYSTKQIMNIKADAEVKIIKADAMQLPFDDNSFDFVYCNPPFMDEEKYSGLPNDIATNDKNIFAGKFIKLMEENYRCLKSGNLCVITINDKREKGYLEPLQAKVIEWGYKAGFLLWDFVICEVLGTAMIFRKKAIEQKRTAKCHEYVITFKKP